MTIKERLIDMEDMLEELLVKVCHLEQMLLPQEKISDKEEKDEIPGCLGDVECIDCENLERCMNEECVRVSGMCNLCHLREECELEAEEKDYLEEWMDNFEAEELMDELYLTRLYKAGF